MLSGMVVAQLEGANQAALFSGLVGQSYTVEQVAATANGMGTSLLLTPDGGAAVGQGVVALKLEGARQMAQMSGLVGKSVTIAKAPVMAGGTGHWIAFCPNAGLATKGLAGLGAAGLEAVGLGGGASQQLVMLKLEGAAAAAQAPALTGKTFTVVKAAGATAEPGKWLMLQPVGHGAAGKGIVTLKVQNAALQLPMLVGKTVTVEQGPVVAAGNAGNFLFLKPAGGTMIAAKGVGAAGMAEGMKTVAMKPVAMKAVAMKTVAMKTVAGGAGAAGVTAANVPTASAVAKGATVAGSAGAGSGFSLGLGLGLGAMGPLIVGGLVAAAGYGVYHYRDCIRGYLKPKSAVTDEELAGAAS